MAARTGLSSTIAIFRAESRCSPDVATPWLEGPKPLPACAKFPIPTDIPDCIAFRSVHLLFSEARPIPPKNDLKTAVRSAGAARLPYFTADDEILARRSDARFQLGSRLRHALFAGVGMEVGAIAGCRNESGTNGEIAEALSLLPLHCVSGEKRIECGNDARVIEILGVKLVHARTVEGRAEVQVVRSEERRVGKE